MLVRLLSTQNKDGIGSPSASEKFWLREKNKRNVTGRFLKKYRKKGKPPLNTIETSPNTV